MKLKTILLSILWLQALFIGNIKADVPCCGGVPLLSGYICCDNQMYLDGIYMCCSKDDEAIWQKQYDDCIADAKAAKKAGDDTAQKTYNDAKESLEAGAKYVASFCGAPGSADYEGCYDAAIAAADPAFVLLLATYNSNLLLDQTTLDVEAGICWNDVAVPRQGQDDYPRCADGWQLAPANLN